MGEKNGNKAPVLARTKAMVIDIPGIVSYEGVAYHRSNGDNRKQQLF